MTGPHSPVFWLETDAGLLLALKIQPGARRMRIGPVLPSAQVPGWPPFRLKIAVTAPPEEGRANLAVLRTVADWLGIRVSRVTLHAGGAARDKLVLAAGADAAEFQALFAALSGAN